MNELKKRVVECVVGDVAEQFSLSADNLGLRELVRKGERVFQALVDLGQRYSDTDKRGQAIIEQTGPETWRLVGLYPEAVRWGCKPIIDGEFTTAELRELRGLEYDLLELNPLSGSVRDWVEEHK